MNSGLNDSDIVSGLRNGDRSAWDALCHRYGGQLWRYVARLVGSDENSVADVFQDTLLAVSRSGRAISQETHLWAWISRIGHNQAALYWRKRYRERTDFPNVEPSDPAVESQPAEMLSRSETVDSVRVLLSQMNDEHVALLVAKYLDEMTVSEMVQAMGGTKESIRSRLARARRDFRHRYEQSTSNQREASVLPDVSPRKGEL